MDTAGETPGIVRAATSRGDVTPWSLMWPVLAAVGVVAAHAATVRLDAWLPVRMTGPGGPDDRSVVVSSGATWLAGVAEAAAWGLAGLDWPMRLVVVALTATALSIAFMSRAFHRIGLPAVAGAALSLVAAGGALMWEQATAPTGTALLTALSTVGVGALVRTSRPLPGRALLAGAVLGLAGLAVGLALAGSGWGHAGAAGAIVRRELGGPGLILAALGLVHPLAVGIVSAGVLALGVAAPLGTAAQAAAGLPWAWTLAGGGIVTLLGWSGPRLTRRRMAWLAVALCAWAGVQAAGRPWMARAEFTHVSAIWARALADTAATSPIVVNDLPAADRLVDAWLRQRSPETPRLTIREAHALGARATSMLLVPATVARARWMGLPASDVPAALAPLGDVLEGLPPDVVVVVGIGTEAASVLEATDWQALGRLGARLSTVGGPRARAIMSVTGGRQQGDEITSPHRAVLERVPGDPIGTSGHVSPLDMRLDVAARDIALFERGRLQATARDTLLAVYRRNGTLLALWVGAGGRQVGSGHPGTAGPVVRRVADVLPCLVVTTDADPALDALGVNGALGIHAPMGTRLTLTTGWDDGLAAARPRRVGEQAAPVQPTAGAIAHVVSDAEPFGVDLRGRPARVMLRTDGPTSVCAAEPLAPVVSIQEGADVPVHPRVEAAFGRGWHDLEPLGGGQYFRWSSGGTASLLWTLRSAPPPAATIVVAFDLQNAGRPSSDDRLQLSVNGTALAAQSVAAGRGLYSWTIPGTAFHAGLNELRLDTTLTVRPADLRAGADGRRLGFALHGWRVECAC